MGLPEGIPPVAPVYQGEKQLGYLFVNSDFVNSTGYSGKPIHMLVAMDMQGLIRKVVLVEHHEPIVLIGIPESRIVAVLDDYEGINVADLARGLTGDHKVDVVTGATVTIMVMDDTILRSAIKVARRYALGGLEPEKASAGPRYEVDMDISDTADWVSLISDGSIRRLKMTLEDINRAYNESGDILAADQPEKGDRDEIFIEMYAALVSVPTIGRSLLGEGEYRNLQARLEPGQQAILIAGNGRYSFKGSGYVRGGIFDRFQLIQGDISARFHDSHHKRLRRVAADGAPRFTDVDIFRIPTELGFEPGQPWKLELLVGRFIGPTQKSFLTFDLNHETPDKYLRLTEPGVEPIVLEEPVVPLWRKIWQSKLTEVAVLLVALVILTLIFFFQNTLVERPKQAERIRVLFLIFTLVGIGWYANAQLSVVNILTVINALLFGFSWEYFLMEPLIFILWGSVAASLLFWGRGPFCGWLCPFGALQELLSRMAKAVRIPQVTLPWGLHERLWTAKYIIFLVLFGFSLHSLEWAERLAEVEPFKTTIILKFVREWPYVLFAVVMLAAGLFIERFYCRYICPLGAALAIPGRLRMFEWLKRYKECGSSCQRCANDCMVQAIHPLGNINVNECLYCLHCQELYFDEHACPVMIQKRQKRERRAAWSGSDTQEEGREMS